MAQLPPIPLRVERDAYSRPRHFPRIPMLSRAFALLLTLRGKAGTSGTLVYVEEAAMSKMTTTLTMVNFGGGRATAAAGERHPLRHAASLPRKNQFSGGRWKRWTPRERTTTPRRAASQRPSPFTPTYSSWINQVERWFAEIQRRCLDRGVFCSLEALTTALQEWIKLWNDSARPFKWTKSPDHIIDSICRYCDRISRPAY
jgi:hypothetical protein